MTLVVRARAGVQVPRAPTVARAALALLLAACHQSQSMLNVRGPGADRIAGLWWLMLWIATAVFIGVVALIVAASRRRNTDPRPDADRKGLRWIIAGGIALPATVLTALFVVTLGALADLRPAAAPSDLVIRVTGRRWWWDVAYFGPGPSDLVITANEIHIPVGRRVRVELTSADVIHSLWIPNLQGKTDLVPGRTTITWLAADSAGVSRGQCAEFCGIAHARMSLVVVAEPPEVFERWLAAQRAPAALPADSLARFGRATFLGAPCAGCHAIRGTAALARLGPDLTHLASRATLAAGTLPNTRGHLAGWISNPQALKPGVLMPNVGLTPVQLHAVVRYLEALE